jgi:hypothetical protein
MRLPIEKAKTRPTPVGIRPADDKKDAAFRRAATYVQTVSRLKFYRMEQTAADA